MAKHVFIFGAGASFDFGAPVMSNFLDESRRLFAEGRVKDHAESFAEVFEGISKLTLVHSKSEFDHLNIESIFTAFEMAKLLQRFPEKQASEIDQLIDHLKVVIVVTLEQTLRFPVRNSQIESHATLRDFISPFVAGNGNDWPSVAFLTFNYDIALDMALFEAGLRPDYGLAPLEPNRPVSRTNGSTVPLLKLHGSLNFAVEPNPEGDRIVPWELRNYFSTHSVPSLFGGTEISIPIGTQIQRQKAGSATYNKLPLIVPPSWNKADSHRAITSVWARAAKELAEAESIYVIGYSLPETDSFFRQLYALGTVSETILQRFWVFNPDDSRKKTFQELLGPGARRRFRFLAEKLGESLNVIHNEVKRWK